MEWIQLAPNRVKSQAFVHAVTYLHIPQKMFFLDQLHSKDSVPCSYSLMIIKLHCRHSDQL
jgi:hypothetical protein